MNDPSVSMMLRDLASLEGLLSREEVEAVSASVAAFQHQIVPNITWFLESMSKFRAVVGFALSRAERVLQEHKAHLARVYSARYNAHRMVGLSSKVGKSPPAEALKNLVKGDSEYCAQSEFVLNAEYCRNLLRELSAALSSRSSEVDQITNNARLEVRMTEGKGN